MKTPSTKEPPLGTAIKPKVSGEDWIMRAVLIGIALYLLITMVFPLYAILSKSFQTDKGVFIGLDNYIKFFSTPALFWSIQNSFFVTIITCLIVVPVAFTFAYALTRSCMPFKGLFKGIALIPILMPSLLPAIALVYLFGAQGLIKGALLGHDLYGPIGIIIGESIYVFPHVLTIMLIAMSTADARLYEAAQVLLTRVSKWSWLKAWAVAVAKRRGQRRAIVALARRLAVIMLRMWRDGTEFRWARCAGEAA